MRRIATATLLLAAALLASPGAAKAASQFDGVYAGPQRETLNNNSGQCTNINRDRVRLEVKDGVARYRWAVPIEATIQPNGSFLTETEGQSVGRGGTNQLTFKGQITGDHLEADVGTNHCAAHLSLTKG